MTAQAPTSRAAGTRRTSPGRRQCRPQHADRSPRTRPRTWRLFGGGRYAEDRDLAVGLLEVVAVVLGHRHHAPVGRLAVGALERLDVGAHPAVADLDPHLV